MYLYFNTECWFLGLKQRWQIDISLEFATIAPDGLLFYIGRYDHKNDVMAVELRNGKVYYIFSAGDDVQTVSVGGKNGESITNGQWNKITISYQNQVNVLMRLFRSFSFNFQYP